VNSNNKSTEESIIELSNLFDPKSGIALVNNYENEQLFKFIDCKNKKVLEIGCGCLPACMGIPDILMPKYYAAIDTTPDIILAAKKFDNRPDYYVGSIENIPFDDFYFDIIIMRGVLHHLHSPINGLNLIKKKIKGNGDIYIYEPNLSCLPGNFVKWILLKFFNKNLEESPYGQLPRNKILDLIYQSGFVVKKEWYSSLMAFPLSGDYGRINIIPNKKWIFSTIINIDKTISSILHKSRILARTMHWRSIFQIGLK
jgi:SAM-dependent methyltransferase